MAAGGTFETRDPSPVVDLLEEKVLRSGVVGRLLRRLDGVLIRPMGGGPQAVISQPGLTGRRIRVLVEPTEMPASEAARLAMAKRADAPLPRVIGSTFVYEFPPDASASVLVTFALDALRAMGARTDTERWTYEGTEPESA